MMKFATALIAGATVAASLAAVPAEAQPRGGSISIQGSGGRGGTLSRSVNRQPGSTSVSRGIQTNSGRGSTTTRGGSWANGTYSGGATHTTNNGRTWGRSTSATANGNRTGNFSSTATGPNGRTGSVSGIVSTTAP